MAVTNPAVTERQRTYLSPDQVCDLIPGMTRAGLSQLRFRGKGPRYYKPSPKKVVYELEECLAWLESTARTGTAQEAS